MSRELRKLLRVVCLTMAVLASTVDNDVSAQSLFLMSGDSTYRNHKSILTIGAGADYRSNALDINFMTKMVRGGIIGRDVRKNVNSGLKDWNRIGASAGMSIDYLSLSDTIFGKTDLGMKILVQNRYDTHSSFSENFYKLIFEGNTQFRGQTVELGEVNGEYLSYQKFGFGLFHKKTLSQLTVSFVNGQDFYKASTTQADLFTSEIGDSLHLIYEGSVQLSDTAHIGFGSGNGIGFALDARINIPLSENKGFISIGLNDFGLINWSRESMTLEADSSFSYTGIAIEDIFGDSLSQVSVPVFEDSLAYTSSKGEILTWLPASIDISLLRQWHDDDFIEAGMEIKPNTAHIPKLYLKYHYLMDAGSAITAQLAYGGYGKLRLGAGVQKYWQGWYFNLWTEDVPGLILNDLRGRGGWVSITKLFGTQ
jgi:hypothetical protein